MGNVTIIEPAIDQSEWPVWALEAWDNGNFFEEAVRRVEDLEKQLAERSTLQRFMAWVDSLFPNN